MQQFTVQLSCLIPGKHNPRKVKPARDAHARLVASIRTHGLIHPLVVRPADGRKSRFIVVAGNRRLMALQEIHRSDGNPKILCILRKLDEEAADALSLGENFAREPMHPLDEAEAFSKLASQDGKDAKLIGSDFGVSESYVKQRMRLATLCSEVKQAYRQNVIDTTTAEAFASVPAVKQQSVWKELNGQPHDAEQVRRVIANDWIDASLAQFDVKAIPESAVSSDLFNERTLIERKAFMEAQAAAVESQRQSLLEDGWSNVIVAKRGDVQDQLYSMEKLERQYDPATSTKLRALENQQKEIDSQARKLKPEDEVKLQKLQDRFDELEGRREKLLKEAPVSFSDQTKAKATVFVILDPDGQVHQEYRIARPSPDSRSSSTGSASTTEPEKDLSTDDLSDRQRSETFTQQALAVREALLKDNAARRKVLLLILHDRLHCSGLAIKHEANDTTVHATMGETFKSPAFDRLQERRKKLDPFFGQPQVETRLAYKQLGQMQATQQNALIDLLIVECLTAHLQRPTELVQILTEELKVNLRQHWMPNANWLAGFQKAQLTLFVTELLGKVNAPSPDRKKSEMVQQLDKLFADAASGKQPDKKLADKLNAWLPANMRKNSER